MGKSQPTAPGDVPDVIFERIEAQRARLWQARAIIETVSKCLDEQGETGDDKQAQPLWWSLQAVSELIENVNHRLDPAVISARAEVGDG
jgi:hypothetical protein